MFRDRVGSTIILAIGIAVLAGCATDQDLKRLRAEVFQKTSALEERDASLDEGLRALKAGVAKNGEAIAAIRKNQAEFGADVTELRDGIQQLRGALDSLRKDQSTMTTRTTRSQEESKDIRARTDRIAQQVAFLENFLGLGKKDEVPAAAGEKAPPPGAAKDAARSRPDKEIAYAAAYDLFKEGKYDRARTEFQNYLKQFPDTEYSDNAQFWIGECFYFENKFEKAILEYDKVIKNYPEGDKVSYALLKQGLSFQRLGDKVSAKLILQQLIKDFPNTNQARIARTKLMELK